MKILYIKKQRFYAVQSKLIWSPPLFRTSTCVVWAPENNQSVSLNIKRTSSMFRDCERANGMRAAYHRKAAPQNFTTRFVFTPVKSVLVN